MRTVTPLSALALAIVISLGAAPAHAAFRASFDPLTVDSRIPNRYETASLRPLPAQDGIEEFFSFTTRSLVPGKEGSREIWLHRNLSRAGIVLPTLADARLPMLRDITGRTSYLDPAWSPDGRFLAYVKTDAIGSNLAIYVQEFQVSEDIAQAVVPVGDPILVTPPTPSVANRHPNWSPDGNSLTFDSTVSGKSFDIYTVTVFPAVGVLERQTFDDSHAEQAPAWSPEGDRIAYTTNYYGPAAIAVVDLTSPQPHTWSFAELDGGAPVNHLKPSWSSDGKSIYYHAPHVENQDQLPDIWKLDLDTKAKCAISIDLTADSDADISRYVHHGPDGIPFNYFVFTSMAGAAAGFQGPNIWRGQLTYNCVAPLAMGVNISPNTIQLGSSGQTVSATISFPPETVAAGYQSASYDGPLEGVKMRLTVIASPTIAGTTPLPDPATGNVAPLFTDRNNAGAPVIDVPLDRKALQALLIERGLIGKNAALEVNAYSNDVGRAFRGFAYIKLTNPNASASAIVLQQAGTNPFRTSTVLRITTQTAGPVTIRVFNARGQLVRTLAEEDFSAGRHEIPWDGRDNLGLDAPSGIYYAQARTSLGTEDKVKLLLMR